eukprot:14500088-Alexandrium_andersonii.AAC.1
MRRTCEPALSQALSKARSSAARFSPNAATFLGRSEGRLRPSSAVWSSRHSWLDWGSRSGSIPEYSLR